MSKESAVPSDWEEEKEKLRQTISEQASEILKLKESSSQKYEIEEQTQSEELQRRIAEQTTQNVQLLVMIYFR